MKIEQKVVALTLLKKVSGDVNLRSAEVLDLIYQPKNEFNQPYFYVFNGSKGFVIVSGDDRATPILAYSEEGEFNPDKMSDNMAFLLDQYKNEIKNIVSNKIVDTSAELRSEWQNYEKGVEEQQSMLLSDIETRSYNYTEGDYLIKTRWDQISPYNSQCPLDSITRERAVVGCTATAMAQVMRYWGAKGVIPQAHGSNAYTYGNFSASADFGGYDYSKMPERINMGTSEEQEMISRLSYHCGVACNIRYGLIGNDGSGATLEEAKSGLVKYMGFSNRARVINAFHFSSDSKDTTDYYNYITWKNIIKREIEEERPVMLSAQGEGKYNFQSANEVIVHSWVCDGYNSNDFFHMNWGYGGRDDVNGLWCKLYAASSNIENIYTYFYYYRWSALVYLYPENIPANIIYVTPEGAGKKDGSSWSNAASDLYNIMKEDRFVPTQIWVKNGTYYGNTSDTVAFVLGHGVMAYGGFNGTEQTLAERNVAEYPSILDGLNVRKVICSSFNGDVLYENGGSIIDGFTIQNGNDLIGKGGGVSLYYGNTISNCIMKNNISIEGGGVYNDRGTVKNCSFINNTAKLGGAIYNNKGTVYLDSCYVTNNTSDSIGGGIYNKDSLFIAENSIIANNTAKWLGGGIYSVKSVVMEGGEISANYGQYGGGGIYSTNTPESDAVLYIKGGSINANKASTGAGIQTYGGQIYLLGGLISYNEATYSGGGVYNHGSLFIPDSSTVKIQSNFSGEYGGGIYTEWGTAEIKGGTIGSYTNVAPKNRDEAIKNGGNSAKKGAGIFFKDGMISFNNSREVVIGGNFASDYGGGISIENIDRELIVPANVTISANVANYGGGIYSNTRRNLKLSGCTIQYNQATYNGGGIYYNAVYGYSLSIYGETSIINNKANASGGGIYNNGNLYIQECLISNNGAQNGGGIYNNFGSKYYSFSMSGGKLIDNVANLGSGLYNYKGGNYSLSNDAKIKDVVYMYNELDMSNYYRSNNLCIVINSLKNHMDSSNPLAIQLEYPLMAQNKASTYENSVAKYPTAELATKAVNDGAITILNYGWRAVARGVDIMLEKYTPVTVENVVYVTPEGSGKKDGSSWANATSDLYNEMKKDRTDSVQVWVKSGTYYGNTSVGQGANNAAFIIGKGNKIYGGFAGNEVSLSERAQKNPSILDGQSSRRVICQLSDFADNDSTVIDYFTIQNGLDTLSGSSNIVMISGGQSTHYGGTDMTGNGGGAYLRNNGILKNCTIKDCKAKSGGGVFNYSGKVINCSFIDNSAEHAGGLFNRGIASLNNCTVSGNETTYRMASGTRLGYGGGIYNISSLEIYDGAIISENHGFVGNGIYTHFNGYTKFYGGKLSNNTGGYYGGGIYSDGKVDVYGGDIINNQAGQGGGITSHGTLYVYGGNISGNIGSGCGGGISNGGALYILDPSVKISGNQTNGYGGGIAAFNGSITISGGTIGSNATVAPSSPEEALSAGGNISLGYEGGGGIAIVNNNVKVNFTNDGNPIIIGGNYTTNYGGGIYSRASVTLQSNVKICANRSLSSGGGCNLNNTSSLNGCSIVNNSGYYGGGVFNGGYLYIYNNTLISNNEADNLGGAIFSGGYSHLYMYGGTICYNTAMNSGGIYNSGRAGIYGGSIYGNSEVGIYNLAQTEIADSAKVVDAVLLSSSSTPLEIGKLLYHNSDNPIKIQAANGTTVALSQSAGDLLYNRTIVSDVNGSSLELSGNDKINMVATKNGTTSNLGVVENKISVYPTSISSGDKITVVSSEKGMASILNMSGTVLGQYQIIGGIKLQIEMPYASGIYIIRLNTASEEKAVKIIVK